MSPDTISRVEALARCGWGAALAFRGPVIWRAIEGSEPTQADSVAVKLLAARHLGQGLVQTAFPGSLRALWISVDLLHASTMALLAVHDTDRRRAAALTGGIALLTGLGTGISLARSRAGSR